jgi:hypothetical protein
VNCDGELASGGTTDGRLRYGYRGAYRALTSNESFPCTVSGRLEESGRQLVIGPASVGGIAMTRKIFSPADGGFARYLELLGNPTGSARTVTVNLTSSLGGSYVADSLAVLVPPSSTGNTFAITDLTAECCDPILGHVFGGPAAAVSTTARQFVAGNDTVSYPWTVTVPAGQTTALMHFAIQRDGDGAAAAQAEAEALAGLTEPNALVGMSAAERAQVVNFVIK